MRSVMKGKPRLCKEIRFSSFIKNNYRIVCMATVWLYAFTDMLNLNVIKIGAMSI